LAAIFRQEQTADFTDYAEKSAPICVICGLLSFLGVLAVLMPQWLTAP